MNRALAPSLALLLAAPAAAAPLGDGAPVVVQQWAIAPPARPDRRAPDRDPTTAALPILRARLHHAGVTGHLVQAADRTLWLIARPAPDLDRTLDPIRRPGALGLYPVVEDPTWLDAAIAARPLPPAITRDGNQLTGPDEATLRAWIARRISPDHRLLFERRPDGRLATVLARRADLDPLRPRAVTAETHPGPPGGHLQLDLDPADAATVARLTTALLAAHPTPQIAIALDDHVIARPVVREAITGGRLLVTLAAATPAAAAALAARITDGPLPAAVDLARSGLGTHTLTGPADTLDTVTLGDATLTYSTDPHWPPALCRWFDAPDCTLTLGRQQGE